MSSRPAVYLVPLAALLVLSPAPASACGGFFCSSSPVVQSAERVVYALEEDGSLTMSVEITYAGVDDDFAWILPVPTPPEISVGTRALFDALDAASRPSFGYEQRVRGMCRDYPRCLRDGEEPPIGTCPADTVSGPTRYEDARTEPPPPIEIPPPSWEDGTVTIYAEAPVGPSARPAPRRSCRGCSSTATTSPPRRRHCSRPTLLWVTCSSRSA